MDILNWETDLKALAKLEKDEEDYPVLSLIEMSVVDAIESFILRKIKKQTLEQRFLQWHHLVPLDALPVVSITSVITDSGVTLTSDNYKIRDYHIEIDKAFLVDSPLTVKYVGGYAKIPSDLYRAILLQTVYEFQNSDHIGASFVTTDGGTVQTPSLQLLPEVVRLIKNYKHIVKAFL
jgi:hypothetical protein